VTGTAARLSVPDSMFLLADSPRQPMHVGGLCVFDRSDRDPAEVERAHRELVEGAEVVSPLFRRALDGGVLGSVRRLRWADAPTRLRDHVVFHDLDGADGAALLEVVAGLHAQPLPRDRPLWRAHFLHGLASGGFAVYYAIHHSISDGVLALHLVSRQRADGGLLLPWEPAEPAAARAAGESPAPRPSLVRELPAVAGSVAETFHAGPRSSWRRRLSGTRALSAFTVPEERLRRADGTTVNDLLLAACGAALRAHDVAHGEPGRPRAAMVPISLRVESGGSGGNIAAASVCDLGTTTDDRQARLASVAAQVRARKALLRRWPRWLVTLVSAVLMSPQLINCMTRRGPLLPTPFDLVVSNLRGPQEELFLDGARLRTVLPLSVLGDGQPVNVTVLSLSGQLNVSVLYDPVLVDGAGFARRLEAELASAAEVAQEAD
jgi:diacylglycerol O-acyltransferase